MEKQSVSQNDLICYQYKRHCINKMIRELALKYNVSFKDTYNIFYRQFTINTGTDIHILYKLYTGKGKLDVMQDFEKEKGFLTKFYNIVKNEYNENK